MKCQEVTELMQRYLDKDLVEKEYQLILRHLNACPECTSMFEKLQRLSNELESLPKVKPPYNIVDSIMPQLVELDRMNEERTTEPVASSESTAVMQEQRHKPPQKQGLWRRYVSWGWTGGVVAAGIVLGIFIFQNQPLLNENAGSHVQPEMSRMMMDQQSTQNHAESFAAPKSTSSDNIAMFQVQDHSDQPKELASKQPEEDPVVPPASSQGTTKNSPSAGAVVDPSKPGSPVQEERRTTVPIDDNFMSMDQYGKVASQSEPLPVDGNSKRDQPLGISSIEESETEGFPMSQELTSPDQKYTATVIDQRVYILNAESGNEVYMSEQTWKEDVTIQFKEWQNQKVIYEVTIDEHVVLYFIDTSSLEEGILADHE